MKTIKVKDRYKDVVRILIDGKGYAYVVTLPKSLAKKLKNGKTRRLPVSNL